MDATRATDPGANLMLEPGWGGDPEQERPVSLHQPQPGGADLFEGRGEAAQLAAAGPLDRNTQKGWRVLPAFSRKGAKSSYCTIESIEPSLLLHLELLLLLLPLVDLVLTEPLPKGSRRC